jgi:ABC-type iron transport system FetAB ATPase subunit
MVRENQDRPLLLQEFKVKGYKNLTHPIVFGPLGRINVIHGENNVGKSNLLQAIDLYFRLLERGSQFDGRSVGAITIEPHAFEEWGFTSAEIFGFADPIPIELTGTFSFTSGEREQLGLETSERLQVIELRLSLRANGVEARITDLVGGITEQALARILDYVPTVHLLQARETTSRFGLLGVSRRLATGAAQTNGLRIVSQRLRDALFDAKESREATLVRRWELFVEAMKQFGVVLGPGGFDTAFDRQSGHADLVFDSGEMRVPVDLLGSGVQQIVALLGQLLLTPATLVGIEEPELNLRYTLQKQLLSAFQEITQSEHGPEQLFLTSHSPAFEAEESFFAMEYRDGVPTLNRKPRSLARVFTATQDQEDVYPDMHARRPEPICYVSSEGLVMLPEDVRQTLGVGQGGGVSFIPNKDTNRFELWTTDEVERWLAGDSGDGDESK